MYMVTLKKGKQCLFKTNCGCRWNMLSRRVQGRMVHARVGEKTGGRKMRRQKLMDGVEERIAN